MTISLTFKTNHSRVTEKLEASKWAFLLHFPNKGAHYSFITLKINQEVCVQSVTNTVLRPKIVLALHVI